MNTIQIPDETLNYQFAIEGLAFEANTIFNGNALELTKLASSPGPLISDYVTHEQDFAYGTYGIHVGQEDRLTFFGDVEDKIVGYFVDCRRGSPTEKMLVVVEYAASIARRLVVPRGVAHTFDNLAAVITRDEPIWYMDENNPDFNIDNDLISVSRSVPPEDFPSVQINSFRLSDDAHVLFSKFQQRVLNSPASYSQRERIKIGNEDRYVLFSPKTWTDQFNLEFAELLAEPFRIPGAGVRKNGFALTGPHSYTVVPSTDHCVSDIWQMQPTAHFAGQFKLHLRSSMRFTILNPLRHPVRLEMKDLREGRTFEARTLTGDPRYSIVIPAGVAYRIESDEIVFLRVEQIPLTDEDESHLPPLGQDLTWLNEANLNSHRAVPARLALPAQAHRWLTNLEIENYVWQNG